MGNIATSKEFFRPITPRKKRSVWPPIFILACLTCGAFTTLKAGSISAYRESNGRVVFVNEPPGETYKPPAIPAEPAAPANATSNTTNHQSQTGESRAVRSVFQSAWDEMINAAAKRHRIDPALVRAVVQVESNFNPFAVSSRGAKGLMQLIPATARRFGVKNVFDPRANLDGGVRYLRYLMTLFSGDLRLSLAAYNAGENAVDRHSGVPPFPETQDYLRRISEIYPLSAASRSVEASSIASTAIGKYVDSNGVVHFSNTDTPQ
ncbi:MAG: lytic transglycosylase domain-containing protein [Acidobacteria bacterium]|nr:lytic transglycosylase domain-containing protein [Acidobacteriota bacterium]